MTWVAVVEEDEATALEERGKTHPRSSFPLHFKKKKETTVGIWLSSYLTSCQSSLSLSLSLSHPLYNSLSSFSSSFFPFVCRDRLDKKREREEDSFLRYPFPFECLPPPSFHRRLRRNALSPPLLSAFVLGLDIHPSSFHAKAKQHHPDGKERKRSNGDVTPSLFPAKNKEGKKEERGPNNHFLSLSPS